MKAVIPIKHFDQAKGRLSHILSPAERDRLARAMLRDMLTVLSGHPLLSGCILVSNDPLAELLVADYRDVERWSDSSLGAVGLNSAVQAAVAKLSGQGIEDVMVILGDLPLLKAREVTSLIERHSHKRRPTVTLAPDRHREGTNAVLCSNVPSFRYSFGEHSFARHREQAWAHQATCQVIQSPGTSCDIDNPDDLVHFLEHGNTANSRHTWHCLVESGIAQRLRGKGVSYRQQSQEVDYVSAG